jgi:hypothetical protein
MDEGAQFRFRRPTYGAVIEPKVTKLMVLLARRPVF